MNLSQGDSAWVRGLGRTAAERAIKEHINCLAMFSQVEGHLENATQECREYAQVFVHAYAKDPQCFDLPTPTPKCVAILNLSGERLIVYSSEASLVRALTTAGVDQNDYQRVRLGVESVITHAEENGCTLLFTLSLPWQATVTHLQWELHTLKRHANGTVDDGGRVFHRGMDNARATRTTSAACAVDERVLTEQTESVRVGMRAVCVDPDSEAAEDIDNEQRLTQMRKICAALKSEREIHMANLREIEEQHMAALANAARSADARVRRVTDGFQTKKDEDEQTIEHLQREVTQLRLEREELLRERSERASDTLRDEQDAEKLAASVKLAKLEATAAITAKEKAEETLRIERESNALARDAALSSHERRLASKTLEITRLRAAAEEERGSVSALTEVVDRLRTEKEGLQSEINSLTASQQRRVRALRVALAVGAVRFQEERATAMTDAAAAAEAVAAAVATADAATADAAAATAAATASASASAPAPTTAATPAVVAADTAEAASNTDMGWDATSGEVLGLRSEVKKLRAELASATAAPAATATTSVQAASPAATPASPATPAITKTEDAGIQALLEQATGALRALAAAAQAGSEHKLTAERLQGEIAGYQHMATAALCHSTQDEWMHGPPAYGFHPAGQDMPWMPPGSGDYAAVYRGAPPPHGHGGHAQNGHGGGRGGGGGGGGGAGGGGGGGNRASRRRGMDSHKL